MGFFDRIRSGLRKTVQVLNTDVRDLFKSEGRLVDDAFREELFGMLVRTDMGVKAATETTDDVCDTLRGRRVEKEEVVERIRVRLREIMKQPESPIRFAEKKPTVVMVCGVNGCGKTTSIAKLAHQFHDQGLRVVLGAADTFRAAAVRQLEIWAQRLDVELVKGEPNSDPASVAHRAVSRAISSGADVCIVDTAGRLQTQTSLMQELTKIHRVIGKLVDGAPHEVILVLDATTGQNGISQATHFTEAVKCTGLILAKLDGTARGGVVVAIRRTVGLPVKYIGVGEGADDLVVFNADEFVDALFRDQD
ncbi:MAG: signal recognition particle-docking protein FtsY [Planctomycetia bacterium]|nr:signal recognition particle-docking protein FtsY [Planctomycetia bacterium]